MTKRLILSIAAVEIALLKSSPPKLAINVNGWVSTSGWTDPVLELIDAASEVSPDGVLDLNFLADPPDSVVLQVITPTMASFVWERDAERVVAVRVVARTNEQTEFVHQPIFTTMALGEEQPSWPPKGQPTTFRIGEEGPTSPWSLEHLPTGAVGEQFPPTDPRIDDPARPRFPGDDGVTDPGPGTAAFGK